MIVITKITLVLCTDMTNGRYYLVVLEVYIMAYFELIKSKRVSLIYLPTQLMANSTILMNYLGN